MNETMIRVSNLSKRYRIGSKERGYTTIREAIVKGITSPLKNLAKLRDLTRFNNCASPENDVIWALKDISFDVKRGEVFGIIGRNGAGKSTLLKILSRVTEPTGGSIELYGRVSSLLEVGAGFHPELTGRENIFLNGAILGMKKKEIEKKFDDIVKFAEIGKFLDTPVKRYSSGMYVRLAFAVAAHLDPEILLIDEVLAVGDLAFQKKCLGKIETVANGGRTVVFISHNMAMINNLCNRVLRLDNGTVVGLGNTNEVVSSYLDNIRDSNGEIIWLDLKSAPGNEKVKLLSIKIKANNKYTCDVFINAPIVIEVDYHNFLEGAMLDVTLFLRDKTNSIVFASANRPSANLTKDEWYGEKRPKGVFRTYCVIPANLLNDDVYAVDIGISPTGRWVWEAYVQNVISFIVHDTGDMKKEYSGNWVGVIRPRLAWSTQYLGE